MQFGVIVMPWLRQNQINKTWAILNDTRSWSHLNMEYFLSPILSLLSSLTIPLKYNCNSVYKVTDSIFDFYTVGIFCTASFFDNYITDQFSYIPKAALYFFFSFTSQIKFRTFFFIFNDKHGLVHKVLQGISFSL